ncbi:unnamed protein product [Trichobilharzia regenti]|nr:unnamed protein product [Trichobilharzia regenti]
MFILYVIFLTNRALFSDAKIVPSLQTHRRREGSLSSSISTGSGQDDTRSSGTPSFQNNGHTNYSSLSSSSKLNSASGVSLPLMIGWTAGAPVSSSIREQWDYVVNNWEQCSKKKSYVSVSLQRFFETELLIALFNSLSFSLIFEQLSSLHSCCLNSVPQNKSFIFQVMRHTYFGKAAHTTQLVAWAELGEAELDYNVNWVKF